MKCIKRFPIILRTRNGLVYHPSIGRMPRGWRAEVVRRETPLDVAADILLAVLSAGGALALLLGMVWLLGKAGVL